MMNSKTSLIDRSNYCTAIGIVAVLTAFICFTSSFNFLLFHTLVELFAVIIAFSISIVAWNTRRVAESGYLLFLGIAYFFIGTIDLMHTLTYKGLNIIPVDDADTPTQLWICARYMESITLLVSPFFINKPISAIKTILIYLAITAVLWGSIFWTPVFPSCFVEEQGLTAFKIYSEYLIIFILCGGIIVLTCKRQEFEKTIYLLLIGSLALTMLSELFFTFYISVFGISNLAGHVLKVISFVFIYQAIIVSTLTMPYQVLFSKLAQSEQEKDRIITELKDALQEINTLQGIIPICSHCKQIRDDKGYWNRVEEYFAERTEIQFSHGICPKCLEKLYPDLCGNEENDLDGDRE